MGLCNNRFVKCLCCRSREFKTTQTFIDNGELEGLWGNKINTKRLPSVMDGIEGITFDSLTRQLTVQTSGCYDINNSTKICIDGWGVCQCQTEKFTQWQLPDDRKGVVVEPS